MLMKTDVILEGLHPVMRVVKAAAENAFIQHADREAIITSGLDGAHSPGSFHAVGLALDFRTNDLSRARIDAIVALLTRTLPDFETFFEDDHIHVEPNDTLAKRLGALP